MNNRRVVISTFLFLIVSVWGVLTVRDNNNGSVGGDPVVFDGEKPYVVLFYSDYCSHCKNVEAYIEDNGIEEKINIDHKEVSSNSDNADQLMEKASFCGLGEGPIGVPFLFDGEKCYVGDIDIVDFLKNKIDEN